MSLQGSPPVQPPGRRIAIVGSSGAGKTTLAQAVALRLKVPHVEIDALNWEANWTMVPQEVLRSRLAAALAGPAWVVDGNYGQMRDLTWGQADTLIWLELPLAVVFWRLLKRTSRRILAQEELWNGNRESLTTAFFEKNSLFVHMLRTRRVHHDRYPLLLQQPEYCHLNVIHFHHPNQVNAWLETLSRG